MIQDSYTLAKAFGYLSYFEVVGLKAIAGMLPKGAVCINLGAGSGTSSLALCEDRNDLIDTFFTVDISQEGPLGGLRNEQLAFQAADLTSYPKGILGDTIEVSRQWTHPIDYLFIDDDHSYEHLSKEIDVWFPHLAEKAIVVFHDYGSSNWSGVKRAVDEKVLSILTPMFLLDTLIAFRKGFPSQEDYAPTCL